MRATVILLAAAAGWAFCASAQAQGAPSRGALLYATHCVECHDARKHWRDGRQVRDWASLRAQVRHWQDDAKLGWSDADVEEVARHLNETFYRLPAPRAAAGPAAGPLLAAAR